MFEMPIKHLNYVAHNGLDPRQRQTGDTKMNADKFTYMLAPSFSNLPFLLNPSCIGTTFIYVITLGFFAELWKKCCHWMLRRALHQKSSKERGREKQRIVICVVGNEKWNEGRKEEDRKDITK